MKNKVKAEVDRSNGLAKRIVLTGGPGVGKSSILKRLEELGHSVRHEVFTKLFAEAQKSGRFNDKYLHSKELVHELLIEQTALEVQPTAGEWLFLDRSRIDIWGFAKNMGVTPFPQDQRDLESGVYDLVLVIEPLPEKYYDQNQIRRQNFKESLEHHQAGLERYREFFKAHGKNPAEIMISIPFVEGGYPCTVQDRVAYIFEVLSSRSPANLSR